MVMPDWTGAKPKPLTLEFEPERLAERLARPLDRLAAVIVDIFVLLVPIYVLLSAPLKRWLTASFILGSEPDFILQIFFMVLLAIVLVVSYQSVMHFLFRATVGKMLFDLRVKTMFGEERLSFSSCFARAVFW